ncbi:MAG: alkylhydroperoxidase, partial [Actinomycetota bacterium]|nr:alkylhydroperoxidase [Actinomycetota bacterium]
PEDVGPDDAEALRTVGLTDDDIWDVVSIVGFFGLSNRLAHAFDMRPNPEFFLMGRTPR